VPVSNTIAEFAIWIGKNSDRLKGMPFNKFQELVKAEFDGMVALSTLYKYAKLVGVKPRGKKANGSSIAPDDMKTILARLDSLEKSIAQALELLQKMPQVKQVVQQTVDDFWNRPLPNPFLPKVSWQNNVYNSVNPFEPQADLSK